MPHLRFTRDKRGYENTYVVHSVRRRGKARQRILYWFRTPPNVRVGRAALDEDAIRLIEENNPDIEFDWTKILEAQPSATPPPVETRDRRRRVRGQAGPGRARVSGADVRESAAEPAASAAVPDTTPMVDAPLSEVVTSEVAELPEIEPPVLVPVTVYHGGADVLVASVVDESPRQSAVEARLGSELLGRIRARYAEISARITERVGGDPARLEEMRRAAEALNPDLWVTEDEIAAGLQHFDARLGEIRRALGIKRRRRSRRGGRRRRGRRDVQGPAATPGSAPATLETGPPDHPDELDESDVGGEEGEETDS
ncbi:MAG TPA: hypothetical protein VH701_04440 [Vicinamibacterales bacterium]